MGRAPVLLVKEIYYPILAIIGVPANLLTIVILSRGKCGLAKCSSLYMVGMASADLLVMVFNVMVCYIFTYHFPHSFLTIYPLCKFIIYMSTVTLDLSVWFTLSFTFDRCVAICSRKLQPMYCTGRTATVVLTTLALLIVSKNIPFLFAYEPMHVVDGVQWDCRVNIPFFTSPAGVGFLKFHAVCVGALPFAFMFVFNSVTATRILAASRARRALRRNINDKQSDPEVANRRKSVILVFTISGSFVLLWITAGVTFAVTGLTNANRFRGDLNDPAYVATEVGAMLKYMSSCSNTCIYALTQSKFREQLKDAVTSHWRLFHGSGRN
ncbi:probable G-protein coupled receptor 139 [Amblyraja radiata]|uniref:probable G-protein coupled receptor 139 n=1 Tax=Amblyraja radiata TaxID=386614 RepID=UPI0014021791|nr:probable G-protein coupled receptor 139 [Amblyraja radiata]